MIWFHVKCLEVIFIRVLIKGYLKNISENEITNFEYRGIRNKNKITYVDDDSVKFSIKIGDDEIIVIRDGNGFINTFVFNVNRSNCNYFVKDNNYDVDIKVDTIYMEVSDNIIYIKYLIVDSGCVYEYKLEMSDILWV